MKKKKKSFRDVQLPLPTSVLHLSEKTEPKKVEKNIRKRNPEHERCIIDCIVHLLRFYHRNERVAKALEDRRRAQAWYQISCLKKKDVLLCLYVVLCYV